MNIRKGFEIIDVCGEHVLMSTGEANVDFTNVINFNDTSLFIWRKMEEGNQTIDSLTDAITAEYEIDEETARKDIEDFVNRLTELKVINI